MGRDDRYHRARIRSQSRSSVEAEPADPQQSGAHHGERQIEWRQIFGAVTMAPAHHLRRDQAADSGAEMHHQPSGKIQHARGAEEAAAPYPMGQRNIDEHEPAGGKQQIGRKPHPVGDGARHQRYRYDRKRHLVEHEQAFRNSLGCGIDAVHGHADQKPAIERPEPGTVADEHQRITQHHPENRNDRYGCKALRHGGQHVLLAHHAGIEQRQPRYRHHQHQRCGYDHPRGVGGADVRDFGKRRRRNR